MTARHPLSLHVTRTGSGPTWLFLHAAAASPGEAFRSVARRLEREIELAVPDLLGEGRSPALPGTGPVVDFELDALRATLRDESWPLVIVGHGYGGLLALELARREPARVEQLVLLEPAALHLLRTYTADDDLYRMHALTLRVEHLIAAGELESAARTFSAYWSTPEAFAALPDDARRELGRTVQKLSAAFREITALPVGLSDYAEIRVPTAIIRGTRSPKPMRWICAQLALTLRSATLFDIADAGHMSQLTHPHELAFLLRRYVLHKRDTLDAHP